MGFGGISPGSLLLIFLIVLVLFGTKKLRSIGEDLGQAVRGFRRAFNQEEPWYRPPAEPTRESALAPSPSLSAHAERDPSNPSENSKKDSVT